MPSDYSPNLRIELIANGEQSGTWGSTTNNNLGTLIEDAIAGYVDVTIAGAAQALQASPGVADEARNMTVSLNGGTEAFTLYIPPAEKVYVLINNTAFDATVSTSNTVNSTTPISPTPGHTVAVPAGSTILVYCDGVNVYSGVDHIPANFSVAGDLSATGSLGIGGDVGVVGSIAANALGLNNPLAVAFGGTGTTTLTNGGILRGNGTSAVSAASEADIVAAIGTTAVANSTNTTNVLGGAANKLVYNTAPNVTAFLDAPTTAAQFLKYDGSALVWSELPASGVLSVTASSPLASSGGANPNITINSAVGPTLGGTGISTYTAGDILYASATNTLAKLAGGTGNNGKVLTIAAGVPTWGAAGLTSFTISTGTTLTGGTTVNTSGQTVTLGVASGGITATQLASNAVTEAKIASNAVTTAKIADDAVTEAKIANMSSSVSANGYQIMPSGLIMMWGYATISANTTTITFSSAVGISFTTACYSFTASPHVPGDTGGADNAIGVSSLSSTSALLSTATGQTGFYWVAFGK